MKTKAAVLTVCGAPRPFAKSKPIQIAELDLDPPGEGEVLVKVGGGGLCHSDLSLINGDRPRPVPIVLGHGVRLWDGLEALEDTFDVESVSSPSGVTHLTFTRRG